MNSEWIPFSITIYEIYGCLGLILQRTKIHLATSVNNCHSDLYVDITLCLAIKIDTLLRQQMWLPTCPRVISLVPLKWSSQFPHKVSFTKKEMPWCPCPLNKNREKNPEAYRCGCNTVKSNLSSLWNWPLTPDRWAAILDLFKLTILVYTELRLVGNSLAHSCVWNSTINVNE